MRPIVRTVQGTTAGSPSSWKQRRMRQISASLTAASPIATSRGMSLCSTTGLSVRMECHSSAPGTTPISLVSESAWLRRSGWWVRNLCVPIETARPGVADSSTSR